MSRVAVAGFVYPVGNWLRGVCATASRLGLPLAFHQGPNFQLMRYALSNPILFEALRASAV